MKPRSSGAKGRGEREPEEGRGSFEDGLDELWRAVLAPRLAELIDVENPRIARDLRAHYRRLSGRPGFEQLKRSHPADAVQLYLESVPGLLWTLE